MAPAQHRVNLSKSHNLPVLKNECDLCNVTGADVKHSNTFGSSLRYIKLQKNYIPHPLLTLAKPIGLAYVRATGFVNVI